MDGPTDRQRETQLPSLESTSSGDPGARPTLLNRLLKALASPMRAHIVGSLDERQQQLAQSLHELDVKLNHLEPIIEEQTRMLEKLRSMQETVTPHIEALEKGRIAAMDDIAVLREDAERARKHLASLQGDGTELQGAVAKLADRGDRFEDLWADLHRDMTTLAEALSRLERD